MREVVIASAVRTGIGNFQGGLSSFTATELGAKVILEALKRAGLQQDQLDEVIMGNVLPHGLGQNPARQAVLKAELPYEVGAITVNKVCGSGLKAVMLAAQAIACGDADVVVAGGMEVMSQAPYLLPKMRTGYRMGHGEMLDAMIRDGLWDINNDFHMGYTAELIAEKFKVSRTEQDEYSLRSYDRALAATKEGRFDAERMSVMVPQRKGDPTAYLDDEAVRPSTLEKMSSLRAVFKKDGTVTAANASKISDGAAALVVTSKEYAEKHGLPILARVGAQASAGIDPLDVLVAPIKAIPKVLKKAGLSRGDIDLYEINEAFASSTLAVMKELELSEDRVNVNGGAIALGHPIGASGARVLVTLLSALEQRSLRRGLATLCLGGGEAVALIVERVG
ncbi:MAG: acetyl-CoA C-acetyltransferase [Myxococcales bacterium]|nr:acetyl-CoA C-acetyltransferase [Myxococcales bacterium]